jgi:phosphatidylinositol alpha 1,6-mannosyltransferase
MTIQPTMGSDQLRVALFSGNYNYVRDGANQALNRLVDYLLRQGVAVRVYSPTTPTPAFPASGDLISVRSLPFPFGRAEYRFAVGMPGAIRRDLAAFAPNVVHLSAPDILGHRALSWARNRSIPTLASMHTRFETYLRYYGLAFAEPALRWTMRRFYRRCDAVLAPSQSMAQIMREERMSYNISIWTRGIDTSRFNPAMRDLVWRRSLGIADNDVVVGFLGRLVMEKGLDVFAETIEALTARGIKHRVMVIGEGPARDWFERHLPGAVFTGFLQGPDLGRALASMDMLCNPSVTEAFGNINLEAMASHIPVIAARAPGNQDLVRHGETGRLIRPGMIDDFTQALAEYCTDTKLRETNGAAGLAASHHYDWDRVNQAVLDAYLRLIPRHIEFDLSRPAVRPAGRQGERSGLESMHFGIIPSSR